MVQPAYRPLGFLPVAGDVRSFMRDTMRKVNRQSSINHGRCRYADTGGERITPTGRDSASLIWEDGVVVSK